MAAMERMWRLSRRHNTGLWIMQTPVGVLHSVERCLLYYLDNPWEGGDDSWLNKDYYEDCVEIHKPCKAGEDVAQLVAHSALRWFHIEIVSKWASVARCSEPGSYILRIASPMENIPKNEQKKSRM